VAEISRPTLRCVVMRVDLAAEVDVLGLDRPGRPAPRRLVSPIQVRVRDHLLRRRRTPWCLALGRVGVADEGRVVAPGKRAVERRAVCAPTTTSRPTPFCTSTTRSAVFGRFSSVVMVFTF
jgi:hypothetical protein